MLNYFIESHMFASLEFVSFESGLLNKLTEDSLYLLIKTS